ncbi:cell wall metabolism sensor histidine kinase WalK [Paenibacillus endoradicis]|uniref:cell wall metabolism sensor histidine kinase WalK n=1 Tax=Paenibacillus endoradicis TaxID=2972487 RepID=UPI002158E1F5|nr:cell wall metabolism sensor histidine kinase WalK [Paenibacillus endoradicis]MCR8660330.1 cell wall metabolism sensor histidine kinase WalK [Paenibacillus endoradicis]
MKWLRRLFGMLWHSVIGKLWVTIMVLVAVVLLILGAFLLQYIDVSFDENAHDIKVLFIITAIIGFLLSTFFAFFLSSKIQQPLLQLKDAAVSISEGNYSTRVHIDSSDEIGQLAQTFNNMTEQLEKLIHELHHESNHLSSILRSIGDAVITFDAKGEIILTNPDGHLLTQQWQNIEEEWSTGEVVNYPMVPAPIRDSYVLVLNHGKEITDKIHVQSYVWSVVLTPLMSASKMRGVVAVIRDVTEEHKVDKIRRDFVANISHEIRTPLQMLQGYSEALLDDIVVSPTDRQELVQVIHDESLRMGRLVNDFLDVARMEAGHMNMKHQLVDVNMLLSRVARKFTVFSKERDVELVSQFSEAVLELQHADEDRLEQVVTNLIDNAFRHTDAGKRVIIRSSGVVLNHESFIQLQVKDEGQGIPSEDIPYIFERFYKADKARKRENSSGTGLGLAIVKNIIDQHHGNIAVDSMVGHGTTFTILLPVKIHETIQ